MMQGDEDKKPAAKPDEEETLEEDSGPEQTKEPEEEWFDAPRAPPPPAASPPRVPLSPSAAAKPPRPVKRKPKDMPRRPLSAYNFFFKEEREKLMAERNAGVGSLAEAEHASEAVGKDKNTRKKELFASVGKLIAERWKSVSASAMERYKKMAEEDMDRYNREMSQYQIMMARKKRNREEQQGAEEAKLAGATRLRLDSSVAQLERLDTGYPQVPMSLRSATSAAVRAGVAAVGSPHAAMAATTTDPALRLPSPIEEMLQARRQTILSGGFHTNEAAAGPQLICSGDLATEPAAEESLLLRAALIRQAMAGSNAAATTAVTSTTEPQPSHLRGNMGLDSWLSSSQEPRSTLFGLSHSAMQGSSASLDQLQQHQLQLLQLLQQDRPLRSSTPIGMTPAATPPLPLSDSWLFAGRQLGSSLDNLAASLAQPASTVLEPPFLQGASSSSPGDSWIRSWATGGLGGPPPSPPLTTAASTGSVSLRSTSPSQAQRQRQDEALTHLLQQQQLQQQSQLLLQQLQQQREGLLGDSQGGSGGDASSRPPGGALHQQLLELQRLRQLQQAARHRTTGEEDESSGEGGDRGWWK